MRRPESKLRKGVGEPLGFYMTGKAPEVKKRSPERERRQLDRMTAQTTKEKRLRWQKSKLQNLETGLRGMMGR